MAAITLLCALADGPPCITFSGMELIHASNPKVKHSAVLDAIPLLSPPIASNTLKKKGNIPYLQYLGDYAWSLWIFTRRFGPEIVNIGNGLESHKK